MVFKSVKKGWSLNKAKNIILLTILCCMYQVRKSVVTKTKKISQKYSGLKIYIDLP